MFVQASVWSLCLLLATACKNAPQNTNGGSYKTMKVTRGTRTLSQTYTAVVNGRQSVEIRPQVSGTITQVCIGEGAQVKKGQTLVVIDQVPYKAALETAVANVRNAEASVATAHLTAESKEQLFNEHVVSAFDLQTARNNLLQAEAALAQAKAEEVNARNNLSYTVVKSPSNGVVGELPYRQGALVSSAIPQPLTTVSDNSEMYVYFSMPENDVLSLVRQYGSLEEAIAKMPKVQLMLNDGTLLPDSGRVESISGVIDPNTGSSQLRAAFPNTSHLLHTGSNGNVIMPVYFNDVIVIPQAATFELQDKVLAYKVVDGKAQSVNIQVAPQNNGTEYIVTGGLNVGDVIVAEGAGLLREGTPINANANAAAQQGAQKQGK